MGGLLPSWPWRGKLLWSGQPTAGCMQHASPDAGGGGRRRFRAGQAGRQAGRQAGVRRSGGKRVGRTRRSRRIETERATGGLAVRAGAMELGWESGRPVGAGDCRKYVGCHDGCTETGSWSGRIRVVMPCRQVEWKYVTAHVGWPVCTYPQAAGTSSRVGGRRGRLYREMRIGWARAEWMDY